MEIRKKTSYCHTFFFSNYQAARQDFSCHLHFLTRGARRLLKLAATSRHFVHRVVSFLCFLSPFFSSLFRPSFLVFLYVRSWIGSARIQLYSTLWLIRSVRRGRSWRGPTEKSLWRHRCWSVVHLCHEYEVLLICSGMEDARDFSRGSVVSSRVPFYLVLFTRSSLSRVSTVDCIECRASDRDGYAPKKVLEKRWPPCDNRQVRVIEIESRSQCTLSSHWRDVSFHDVTDPHGSKCPYSWVENSLRLTTSVT